MREEESLCGRKPALSRDATLSLLPLTLSRSQHGPSLPCLAGGSFTSGKRGRRGRKPPLSGSSGSPALACSDAHQRSSPLTPRGEEALGWEKRCGLWVGVSSATGAAGAAVGNPLHPPNRSKPAGSSPGNRASPFVRAESSHISTAEPLDAAGSSCRGERALPLLQLPSRGWRGHAEARPAAAPAPAPVSSGPVPGAPWPG